LIANLGLIFFMFFLGLELDLEQIKRSWKITIPVAATSVIIPGNLLVQSNTYESISYFQWVSVVLYHFGYTK